MFFVFIFLYVGLACKAIYCQYSHKSMEPFNNGGKLGCNSSQLKFENGHFTKNYDNCDWCLECKEF